MHINTNSPTDLTDASLLQQAHNPTSSKRTTGEQEAKTADSTQDLSSLSFPIQEGDLGIQDEAGASQEVNKAILGMLQQPAMAMTAQASQLSDNVLGLALAD